MLALKRLPEKHTLIKLAAQTNKRTQIIIQTGRGKSRQGGTNNDSFKSKEPRLLFRAFTTYVRPIGLLEYDSPVWSPRYAYLINKLESVQRRFTKRLRAGCTNLT